MARDCMILGHVRVDHDPKCLVCGMPIATKDRIGVQIDRPHDELTQASTAHPDEWGGLKGAGA